MQQPPATTHTPRAYSKACWWYGLVDIVDERWITSDLEEVELMKASGFTVKKVFSWVSEATKWKREGKSPLAETNEMECNETTSGQNQEDGTPNDTVDDYTDYNTNRKENGASCTGEGTTTGVNQSSRSKKSKLKNKKNCKKRDLR
mmetsp:Transcript_5012/g.7696  ORF Transcript_5012/g.7696 Transcript_5012/m.7696 type:complete len:146 (+) Transcript_5012:900-1337(+)